MRQRVKRNKKPSPLAIARAERDELGVEVERLNNLLHDVDNANAGLRIRLGSAEAAIERLTAERDDARRISSTRDQERRALQDEKEQLERTVANYLFEVRNARETAAYWRGAAYTFDADKAERLESNAP